MNWAGPKRASVFILLPLQVTATSCLSSNRDLDLNTSLDVDDDLLDNLGRSRQVDQALVDAHLKAIPGLGALTAGGLAGLCGVSLSVSVPYRSADTQHPPTAQQRTYRDLERLGRHADRALGAEVLVLGPLDQLLADLLEGLDLARGQGDAYCLARQLGVSVWWCAAAGGGDGRILWALGASPKSFSGLLYDMLADMGD